MLLRGKCCSCSGTRGEYLSSDRSTFDWRTIKHTTMDGLTVHKCILIERQDKSIGSSMQMKLCYPIWRDLGSPNSISNACHWGILMDVGLSGRPYVTRPGGWRIKGGCQLIIKKKIQSKKDHSSDFTACKAFKQHSYCFPYDSFSSSWNCCSCLQQ